ncbi:MAG: hypothetical protein KQI62_07395 [Deltaproteobacteria bacterium]|nr:hypothetical protein [Deltaproteobacteria bacterium]
MLNIQDWFQGRGYRDPADLILAFVTVQELMRRKGGPRGLSYGGGKV